MQKKLIQLLSHLRIIMVETTLPANIGSAARALHTMGVRDLTVVNPRLPIDDSSFANAAGAGDILQHCTITQQLSDALTDCTMVFAASARSRQMPRPVVTPADAARLMLEYLQNAATNQHTAKIAILFGREDRGLTNEELSYAQYHIQIPANPDYPVLNVASAIQVILATIYNQFSQEEISQSFCTKQRQHANEKNHSLDVVFRSQWDEPAITQQQSQDLNQAVLSLMTQLQLAHDENLRQLPDRLSRLTNRLQLDQKEYALLRALIAKIQQKIKI